jgi:hypothetical protein
LDVEAAVLALHWAHHLMHCCIAVLFSVLASAATGRNGFSCPPRGASSCWWISCSCRRILSSTIRHTAHGQSERGMKRSKRRASLLPVGRVHAARLLAEACPVNWLLAVRGPLLLCLPVRFSRERCSYCALGPHCVLLQSLALANSSIRIATTVFSNPFFVLCCCVSARRREHRSHLAYFNVSFELK